MATEPNRLVEAFKIVLFTILASIIYGIIHDQITARIYLPYFNVWPPHAQFFQHPNPTVVGFYWGVVATWWVGLILGIILAFVSTSGTGNCWTWRRLLQPTSLMMVVVALFVGASGLIGVMTHWVPPYVAGPAVPDDDPGRAYLDMFTAVYSTHIGSYIFGALGGLILAAYVWRKRSRTAFGRTNPT